MKHNQEPRSLFRQPSAWIPLAISLVALSMILSYVAVFGIVQNEDEGTPAHVFQLLMLLQLPVIGYFAFRWLPRRPMQALMVLAAQALAWFVPIAVILWLEST